MTSEYESGSSRLDEILAQYLQRVEAGEAVDREALLRQHPEFADELREFFADDSNWKRVARVADSEVSPTIEVSSRDGSEVELAPTFDSAAPSDSPQVETQRVGYFGDYELLEEIARGGMGVVYKALQVNLDRVVALKMILSGQLASEDDVRRFYQEAEAAANLEHPGIVPIYEIGQHEGQHFFSMAYVDGPSLAELLADGPLPPHEAAQVVQRVAEAIAYAHSRGVIHRDLKPANILLNDSRESRDKSPELKRTDAESSRLSTLVSRPCVTDFGLAKRTEGASELTGTGQILGTPSYMPPEQASGQAKQIGPTADVYSLGAILYCALTGHPPFQAANPMDTLMQVLKKEPPPPRQINAAVPLDVETICLKCLEKDQTKRYANADGLADELQRYLDGKPILARPVGRAERTWRWCRRHPLAASAIAAIDALLIAIVLLVWYSYHSSQESLAEITRQKEQVTRQKSRAERGELAAQNAQAKAEREAASAVAAKESAEKERTKAELARQDAERQREVAEQRQREAQHNLYLAHMNLVNRAVDAGNLEVARNLLARHVPESGDEDLRGFEWFYWNELCDSLRFDATLPTVAQWMAVSPDGRHAAFSLLGPGASHVELWNLDASKGKQLDQQAGVMAFSSDGRRLAIADLQRPRLAVWDVETESEIFEVTTASTPVSVAFSPDDRFVATGVGKKIALFDASGGELVRTLDGPQDPVTSFAFAASRHEVVAGCRDGSLHVWDLESDEQAVAINAHKERITSIVVIPKSESFATHSVDGSIQIWDAESHERQRTIPAEARSCLAVSPDGRMLLAGGFSGVLRAFDPDTGEELLQVQADSDFLSDLAFLPSGTKLLTVGGSTKTWSVKRKDVRVMLPPVGTYSRFATGSATRLAISPDGESLVCSDRSLRSIKGRTSTWLNQNDAGKAVAFSPRGDRFATGSNRGKLTLWDASDGVAVWSHTLHKQHVLSVAFSPDGTLLASGGFDRTALILDAATGELLHTLGGHQGIVNSVAFTADGRFVASLSDEIRLWNVESGQQIESVAAPAGKFVQHITFSPDGKYLAGCGKTSIYLWDAETFRLVKTLSGHSAFVWWIDFSPDSATLASASKDQTAKLWDVGSGQEKASFNFKADVYCVEFSKNGNFLAAADGRNVTLLRRGTDHD